MSLDELSKSLESLAVAKTNVIKIKGNQIRNQEDRIALQALALSWFKTNRPTVSLKSNPEKLAVADQAYRTILDSTEKASTKKTYIDAITSAKAALIALRGDAAVSVGLQPDDIAPDFSPLAGEKKMQEILTRRWSECKKCINADAPMASIVMMGGLLEALFVARANRLLDKSPMFKATGAPLDPKTRKPIDLRDWTLKPYLDVGHELGWITKSAKDVAAVLRDYRNYIHPEKERSHGVVLNGDDGKMLWQITKELIRQLLSNIS